MDYDVVAARYVRDYVVWLRFRDGSSGEVDLEHELHGPVFQPLKEVEYFKRFTLDPMARTLTWPNGADVAPETLHELARAGDRPWPARPEYAESATDDSSGQLPRARTGIPVLHRHARLDMPEICRFFGIVIRMHYDEHGGPHFHAESGEHDVSIGIEDGMVRGEFPASRLRLVLEWADLHQAELLENWERARQGLPLNPIDPLR